MEAKEHIGHDHRKFTLTGSPADGFVYLEVTGASGFRSQFVSLHIDDVAPVARMLAKVARLSIEGPCTAVRDFSRSIDEDPMSKYAPVGELVDDFRRRHLAKHPTCVEGL